MTDDEPTSAELAEAEALARALEGSQPTAAEPAQPPAADALETAQLLRLLQPSAALSPERNAAILERVLAQPRSLPEANTEGVALAARRKHRLRLSWSVGLATAAAAALALVLLPRASPNSRMAEHVPTPPAMMPAAPPPLATQDAPAHRAPQPSAAEPASDVLAQRASGPAVSATPAPSEPMRRATSLQARISADVEQPAREHLAQAQAAYRSRALSQASETGTMDRSVSRPQIAPVARPSLELAAAQAELLDGRAWRHERLDNAVRPYRLEVLGSLASNPWVTIVRDAHARADAAVAKDRLRDAEDALQSALFEQRNSTGPLRDHLSVEQDLLFRLAELALDRADYTAAQQLATQQPSYGIDLVFDVNTAIARCYALLGLKETANARKCFDEARAIHKRKFGGVSRRASRRSPD